MGGQDIPDPAADNLLFGVSCPIFNSCVAVGYAGYGSSQAALVETQSRGSWRVTPSPPAHPPYVVTALNAISCASARTCTAVGSATDATGLNGHTLVESSGGGTWRVTPSPNGTGALNTLSGVSCPSRVACVAVGDVGSPSSQRTLVETMSGGMWALTPSPNGPFPYVVNFLNAVSCVSSTHCVAVGFAADDTGMESRPLIETLAAGRWQITPSPSSGRPLNELFGVHCTTSVSCVAVGDYGNITAQKTLVETLTDGKWVITPSPDTKWPLNELFGASCSSSVSCAAAGYALNSAGTEAKTLVVTLKDGAWRISPTPNTPSPLNEFYGYSCASPTSCFAVGAQGTDNAQTELVEAS
jgi:hypothetical protein